MIPNLSAYLEKLSFEKRQPEFRDVTTLGFNLTKDIHNNYIIYVPIKFKEIKEDSTREVYYGHFGLLRNREFNEYDHLILTTLEETKLDNIIKSLYH